MCLGGFAQLHQRLKSTFIEIFSSLWVTFAKASGPLCDNISVPFGSKKFNYGNLKGAVFISDCQNAGSTGTGLWNLLVSLPWIFHLFQYGSENTRVTVYSACIFVVLLVRHVSCHCKPSGVLCYE